MADGHLQHQDLIRQFLFLIAKSFSKKLLKGCHKILINHASYNIFASPWGPFKFTWSMITLDAKFWIFLFYFSFWIVPHTKDDNIKDNGHFSYSTEKSFLTSQKLSLCLSIYPFNSFQFIFFKPYIWISVHYIFYEYI